MIYTNYTKCKNYNKPNYLKKKDKKNLFKKQINNSIIIKDNKNYYLFQNKTKHTNYYGIVYHSVKERNMKLKLIKNIINDNNILKKINTNTLNINKMINSYTIYRNIIKGSKNIKRIRQFNKKKLLKPIQEKNWSSFVNWITILLKKKLFTSETNIFNNILSRIKINNIYNIDLNNKYCCIYEHYVPFEDVFNNLYDYKKIKIKSTLYDNNEDIIIKIYNCISDNLYNNVYNNVLEYL